MPSQLKSILELIMKKTNILYFIILATISQFGYGMEKPKTTQSLLFSVLTTPAGIYGTLLAGNTCHELGHYAAARMAGIKSENLKINIPLNPLNGARLDIISNQGQDPLTKLSKSTRAKIWAAGPLGGIMGCYAMLKLAHIVDAYQTTKSLDTAIIQGLQKPAVSPTNNSEYIGVLTGVCYHLRVNMHALIPQADKNRLSDGKRLYEEFYSHLSKAEQAKAFKTMYRATSGAARATPFMYVGLLAYNTISESQKKACHRF